MCKILNTDVLIIGGGASGLTSAITVKSLNPKLNVIIAERLSRTGKKILATGNGRCNLGNTNISKDYYHGSVRNYMDIIHSVPNITDFFSSIGLYCVNDEMGRIYPYSNSAASVLNVLRNKINELGIKEVCNFNVINIEKCDNYFKIYNNETNQINAKRVLISAGGCAGNSLGTDGSMLQLLEKKGHIITPLYPSIAPLAVNPAALKGLKGVRVKGIASALFNEKILASEKGEIQFNENNISGICIFNLSYLYAEYGNKLKISIDICPDKTVSDVTSILIKLKEINIKNDLENYLVGLFNKNLSTYLIKSIGRKLNESVSSLKNDDINLLAKKIKSLEFSIVGKSEWKNAQVTYGGISGTCVDRKLQSKIMDELYFAGEILDVDGLCGGYNLTWAWASGIYAGTKVAESFGGKNDKSK